MTELCEIAGLAAVKPIADTILDKDFPTNDAKSATSGQLPPILRLPGQPSVNVNESVLMKCFKSVTQFHLANASARQCDVVPLR